MRSGVTFYSTLGKYTLGVVIALLCLIAWLNWQIAILATVVTVVIYLLNRKAITKEEASMHEQIDVLAKTVNQSANFAIQNLPIGIAIIDNKLRLCWSNSVFKDWLSTDTEKTQKISGLLPSLRLDKVWGKSGFFNSEINGKYYRIVYKFIDLVDETARRGDEKLHHEGYMAFYFNDVTDIEIDRKAAEQAVPVFAFLQIDNLEDVTKGLGDVEYTNLWAEVNNVIVSEFDRYDGFIRNYGDDSYVACLSQAALDDMIANNFPVLERVHNLPTSRRIPVTISMGVATADETMKIQSERARAGLELSLGRGGDQVSVYSGSEVKFYGGKTQGSEKNTRVRARVVSQAIKELMNDSSNVLIMGHEREDYDSIGGAIGVSVLARLNNMKVNIVVSSQDTGIKKLAEYFESEPNFKSMFVTPQQAEELVTDDTLVFVVDVHRPDMVAAPKALAKSKRRVVIDHHRRSSDFIEKPLLTYLEPASSSTSELVTELIQYFSDHSELTRTEASALYAGIVVDTKNFVVQTGSRTFDAASFLRRSGADLKVVRHLFSDTFESLQLRAQMLANTERIGEMAFCHCPETVESAAIMAAQVADILITIEGVEASFTFYTLPDEGIGVSARSQGNINVQVIMEEVGGGGHRTVAGAQLHGMNMTEAKGSVMEVARRLVEKQKQEK